MTNEPDDWFEAAWRYRETVLYPQNVGGSSDGQITTIPYEAFAQFGIDTVDPRWLHCGVLRFPPTPSRMFYSFVTSGLSNAWDSPEPDPASITGLGIELRVDSGSEDEWIVDTLLRLSAMQLLIGAGRFTGRILGHGDRVRLGAHAFSETSVMTTLIAVKTADMQMVSGTFSLLHLFAITDQERDVATSSGVDELLKHLRAMTNFPINDIRRTSAV